MKQKTLTELIMWVAIEAPVSWRVYGMNKELRRPMRHRYPCKAPNKAGDLLAENISRGNALLNALSKRQPFVGPRSPWAEREVPT